MYTNSDPTDRPHIPKQKVTKKLRYIVDYIDKQVIPKYSTTDDDFLTTHTIIYCAAYTAATCNGTKIKQKAFNNTAKKETMPF